MRRKEFHLSKHIENYILKRNGPRHCEEHSSLLAIIASLSHMHLDDAVGQVRGEKTFQLSRG